MELEGKERKKTNESKEGKWATKKGKGAVKYRKNWKIIFFLNLFSKTKNKPQVISKVYKNISMCNKINY